MGTIDGMATATVFVDDAVRDRLPGVCVKDGIPTADRLAVRTTVGDGARLGVAWLLVLAGPLGWIALVLIASARSGQAEMLVAQVPMNEGAFERLVAARHTYRATAIGAVALSVGIVVLGALLGADVLLPFVLSVVGGCVAVAVAGNRARGRAIQIGLDASRRWVTVFDVHPAFAEACDRRERDRDRSLEDR
jgi:hypothetical protein